MYCYNFKKINILIYVPIFWMILLDPFASLIMAQEKEAALEKELNHLEQSLAPYPTDFSEMLKKEDALREAEAYNSIIDNLDVKDRGVNEVLKIISTKTGIKIIADNFYDKKVTISLERVDVFDALRIILDLTGLAYSVESGVVYVQSEENFEKRYGYKFGEKIQTEIVPIQYGDREQITGLLDGIKSEAGNVLFNEKNNSYVLIDRAEKIDQMRSLITKLDVQRKKEIFILHYADPEDAMRSVEGMLTDRFGSVTFGKGDNSLEVTDTPQKVEEIGAYIHAVDVEAQELELNTEVRQITLSDEHIDGVDWSAIVSDHQALEFEGFTNNEWTEKSNISFGTISSEDHDVLVEALETVGLMRVVSSESRNITANTIAELVISSVDLMLSEMNTRKSRRAFVDEEVKIYMQPKIELNNMIDMDIALDVDDAEGRSENKYKELPTMNVNVLSGDTIVVGNLFKDVLEEGQLSIPVLGKIPFLGFAFKKHRHNWKKTEVIVLITPKIK